MVHQIELEKQNEALRKAQEELESARQHYCDLYDLAPVSYVTVSEQGLILEANQAAAGMLGAARGGLVQQPLSRFILKEDQPRYDQHRRRLAETGEQETCDLRMARQDGTPFWVQMQARTARDAGGTLISRIVMNDITERKALEQALKVSEFFFRESQRAAAIGSYRTDFSEGRWESSEVLDAIFGIGRSYERTIQGWLDIVHPEDQAMMGQYLREEVIAGRKDFSKEYRITRVVDGATRWVHGRGKIRFDGAGNALSLIGTIQDITEQRNAEAALGEANELNKQIIRNAQEGIIVYGPDLRYRIWNPYMEQFSGFPASAVLGKHPLELFPFLKDGGVLEQLERVLAGEPAVSRDFPFQVPSTGRSGWASDINGALRNQAGEIIGAIGMVRDITERKLAEDALLATKELLSLFIRHSPIYAYIKAVTPTQSRVLYASDCFRELIGIPGSEMTGMTMEELFPAEMAEKINAEDWAVVSGGKVLELAEAFNGRSFTTVKFPIVQGEATLLAGFTIDITEQKQAEAALLESERRRFQAQKLESLGVLSAGVAHNLNNILGIIMGNASLREQSAADPLDREAFLGITKACARGRDVVKSMLHFAQPTLPVKAPVDLHMLIKEVRVLLENTTRNAIHISEVFADEPMWINGDSSSINHAILNLCLNSLNAMPEGGTLTLRTAVLEANLAEVSIEDDGAGMPPEVLAHVLEPFFTTREVGQGTGLGLSMTHGVVQAHGGSIDIASQPGQGTTVKLRFPRIPAPVHGEPGPVQAAPPSLACMNVFLVDDDEDVRFLMTRMLQKAGVRQVKTFPGGRDVLEALSAEGCPDLIILDHNMPSMNGTQTLERIRRLHPDMPILISSGQPDIEDWDCLRQPRVGVISKPFTMEEIQAKLARFVQELEP